MGDSPALIRTCALFLPFLTLINLWLWRVPTLRERTAVLLSLSWNFPALFLVHLCATYFDFWSFQVEGGTLFNFPVDLYIGWAILWGPIPLLAFPRLNLFIVTMLMVLFDVLSMPLLNPVIQLNSSWLLGEAIGIATSLLPAQLLGRWTRDHTSLKGRGTAQVICFTGITIVLLPATVLEFNNFSLSAIMNQPFWLNALWFQVVAWSAIIGLSAVQEFVEQGRGTPVPFDPPKLLVTSGLYRYVRNPMQLSMMLVTFGMGAWLSNYWIAGLGVMTTVYSIGLASWNETQDLDRRFGEEWLRYRHSVRNWLPSLLPYTKNTGSLYVAQSCDPCSQLGTMISGLSPRDLTIVPAEHYPERDLKRIRYESANGIIVEEGISALARALEHVNVMWALLGSFARLPVIRTVLQLIADSVGGGPHKICGAS